MFFNVFSLFSFSSKIVFKNEREKAKRKEKKGNEYLRASDNNSLVHVLKQKAQSRRSEAHRIRSVQHYKAIVLIISVGNFIRNLYPVKKKLFDIEWLSKEIKKIIISIKFTDNLIAR